MAFYNSNFALLNYGMWEHFISWVLRTLEAVSDYDWTTGGQNYQLCMLMRWPLETVCVSRSTLTVPSVATVQQHEVINKQDLATQQGLNFSLRAMHVTCQLSSIVAWKANQTVQMHFPPPTPPTQNKEAYGWLMKHKYSAGESDHSLLKVTNWSHTSTFIISVLYNYQARKGKCT